jgi:hypothetical protein
VFFAWKYQPRRRRNLSGGVVVFHFNWQRIRVRKRATTQEFRCHRQQVARRCLKPVLQYRYTASLSRSSSGNSRGSGEETRGAITITAHEPGLLGPVPAWSRSRRGRFDRQAGQSNIVRRPRALAGWPAARDRAAGPVGAWRQKWRLHLKAGDWSLYDINQQAGGSATLHEFGGPRHAGLGQVAFFDWPGFTGAYLTPFSLCLPGSVSRRSPELGALSA